MRSIPVDTKSKIHEQFRTSANNADPSLNIIVSRAKSSATDTARLMIDTIREDTNLNDIGIDIQRISAETDPSKIYEVHNDDGEIRTATLPLPVDPPTAWTDGVKIADGTLCKICFNGAWEWNITKNKYFFVTDGDPFLFYTDSADSLQVQTWESSADRAQLATDVTVSIDAIRGWKSNDIITDDQGIIAAYIKTDGKLYYRQYIWSSGSSAYYWTTEAELTISGVTDDFTKIALFRTLDYRLGFIITTDQDEIYWKITEREWSGLAIRPDALEITLSEYELARTLIAFEYATNMEYLSVNISDYAMEKLFGVSQTIIAAENIDDGAGDWGLEIQVTFDEDVYQLTGNFGLFTIGDQDSNSYPTTAIAYKAGSTKIIILTCTDFNGATNDITVTYTAQASTGIIGAAGQDMDTQDFTFTATNIVGPGPSPEVLSIENIRGEIL